MNTVADRLTKVLVIASAIGAGATTLLLAPEWPNLVYAVPIALVVAYASGRCWPSATIGGVTALTYVVPGLQLLALGQVRPADLTVWLAAGLGMIAATSSVSRWSLPMRWRWPLVGWALIIAVAWPIVLLRETEFGRAPFAYYGVLNSGLGVSLPAANLWTLHVALAHTVGILWFDWLVGRYRSVEAGRFEREIVWPLGIGWVATTGVAWFQSTFDLSFMNMGHWTVLRRASGALADANPFGTLAALWGPLALALVGASRRRAGLWMAAAMALSWYGIWVSGSRSALGAGVVLLGVTVVVWSRRRPRASARARLLSAAVPLVVAGVVLGLAAGTTAIGPVARLTSNLEMLASGGAGAFVEEITWNRDGYGQVAAGLIAESPLVGVGIGAFHTLVPDYAYVMGLGRLPPDNAQNWFRHQLAEFGIIGSLGWATWLWFAGAALWKRRSRPARPYEAGLVVSAVIVLGLVSLVGMPTQNVALSITFWMLAFWSLRLVNPECLTSAPPPAPRVRAAWLVVAVIVVGYGAGLAAVSYREFRVPFRALAADWNYAYGFYGREATPDGVEYRWTARSAAVVIPVERRWLRLTAWVSHPDATGRPVDIVISDDRDLLIRATLRDNRPVTRYVRMEDGRRRILLQTEVSRTWTPADDSRELGLALHRSWVAALPAEPAGR